MNRATIHEPRVHGEVSERSKEHAWKVCIPNGIEGSNPSLSASFSSWASLTKPIHPPPFAGTHSSLTCRKCWQVELCVPNLPSMGQTKRTRLSPEERRIQLLDSAKTLILAKGLSSFTMEGLAREAGVSNPLVYKYFDTRLSLLQALLKKESRQFNSQLEDQVLQARNHDELLTTFVSANFMQFSSSNIIYVLREDPDVFSVIAEAERQQHRATARFLVKTLADQFTITTQQAEQLVVLASGASQTAAAHYNRYGGERDIMIADTVRFIRGGMNTLAKP